MKKHSCREYLAELAKLITYGRTGSYSFRMPLPDRHPDWLEMYPVFEILLLRLSLRVVPESSVRNRSFGDFRDSAILLF
jgi:hypothetical protein